MLQTGVISLYLPHAFAGAWGLHAGRAGRAALVTQWEDKLPGPLLCDRHSQMQCGERCRVAPSEGKEEVSMKGCLQRCGWS